MRHIDSKPGFYIVRTCRMVAGQRVHTLMAIPLDKIAAAVPEDTRPPGMPLGPRPVEKFLPKRKRS